MFTVSTKVEYGLLLLALLVQKKQAVSVKEASKKLSEQFLGSRTC